MELDYQIKNELQAKFKIIKLLGKGAFSNVYQCEDKTDFQNYAVKIISKLNIKRSKIETLKEEAMLLKSLSHINIVKIYQYGQYQSCIYIKMEIAKAGTLRSTFSYTETLMEKRKKEMHHFIDEQIAKIMAQIFSGLSYIHSLNIIHRDIKPDNILLTNDKSFEDLKIADFGLSTKLDSHYPKSAIAKCGTLLFMAPQILCKYTYTKAIDIWSAAIIMFMLFTGNHPIWKNKMTTEDYTLIMSKKVNFPELKINHHHLAQNFLNKISKVDPNQRYTAQQSLKHPWITRKFQDQIPLSIHQSYSSFTTANEIVKIMKLFMTLKNICTVYSEVIPQTYLFKKNSSSPMKDTHLKLKKLKSMNIEKKSISGNLALALQKPDQIKKIQKSKIISQSDIDNPTINKLNQIFNTLFDKKITSKTKMTYREKQPPNDNNFEQTPNIDSFKSRVQHQIQISVKECLQTVKARNKTKRILPLKPSPSKQGMIQKDQKVDLTLGSGKGSFIRKTKNKKRSNQLFGNDDN